MKQSEPAHWGHAQATGVDAAGSDSDGKAPESVHALAGAVRIVVVDDDSVMRTLLHLVLTGAGMQVTTFGSAAELLEAGDLAAASVLLLDVKMPGMSGLDLQDLLRNRGIGLPVIFISGVADLAMAVSAMRNGAVDFIEKPFQAAMLIERVRQAVAQHAQSVAAAERVPDPQVLARFATLTAREREVFALLVTGMSSKMIARALGGSFRTIEVHRAQIMRKMAARHLSELVRLSIESRLSHGVYDM